MGRIFDVDIGASSVRIKFFGATEAGVRTRSPGSGTDHVLRLTGLDYPGGDIIAIANFIIEHPEFPPDPPLALTIAAESNVVVFPNAISFVFDGTTWEPFAEVRFDLVVAPRIAAVAEPARSRSSRSASARWSCNGGDTAVQRADLWSPVCLACDADRSQRDCGLTRACVRHHPRTRTSGISLT